jgi:hypothetical protein
VTQPPYGLIADLLEQGRVIPFLGAGASMISRPEGDDVSWDPKASTFLPSGVDLARYLARRVSFPSENPSDRDDLAKVASYYLDMSPREELKRTLRRAFAERWSGGPLHQLLASLPAPLVIVSTNYDLLLEQAFRQAGKPYDLVVYPGDHTEYANAVFWWPHGADEPRIEEASGLLIDLEQTTVIFKMHGSVVDAEDWDSFVISEEDYVEFILRMTNEAAIPAIFIKRFLERSFLFLGYSLRDWNLRVVLRSLSKTRGRSLKTEEERHDWAIQKDPSELEIRLWKNRGVRIFDVALDDFADRLAKAA